MKSINSIDFNKIIKNKEYYKSPRSWEDQVIYFLLVDRFSNGIEKNNNIYTPDQYENIKNNNKEKDWEEWGSKWNGGNIKGVISKLDYLKKLGITTIWLSPIFKQVSFLETYHGYGIQNYLEIDSHLGNKEDLKELVKEVHKRDMYIILDIIINHSGDVFEYENKEEIYSGELLPIKGFRDKEGNPTIKENDLLNENLDINSAIWPLELQTLEAYERKGKIQDWENYPEYIRGDFMSLKTHYLGTYKENNEFDISMALKILAKVYSYWIAEFDIDGYRLDTVKHVEPDAIKFFNREIHEFAQRVGKDNFYIIGEITGGFDFAYEIMKKTGLDAALGINNIPNALENVSKGYINPKEYFNIFSNTNILGPDENLWYKDNVVTMFDDHDMVSLGGNRKYRFTGDKETALLLKNCLFLNVMTLGIPCIYYGTEQAFDGNGFGDKYVRECMFESKFGAFRTQNYHFFDENNDVYKELSDILKIRSENLVLRHGRQFLRKVSLNGKEFHIPKRINENRIESIITWSKILSDQEAVLAFNTSVDKTLIYYILMDDNINDEKTTFSCIYSSDNEKSNKKYKIEKINDNLVLKVSIEAYGRIVLIKDN